ncbi:MAG: serine hydrolase [Erythrobacter sp.]
MTKHLPIVFAALLLGACSVSQDLETAAAPAAQTPAKRDVAAYAQSMMGISVLDVDRFEFTAQIAGCPETSMARSLPAKDSKLDQAISKAKSYSDTMGGTSLLVLIDGKIVHESYDGGNSASGFTDSYSMQKSLVAITFAAALDDKIISSLDEAVGPYIPQWSDDERASLSFRDLLNMASGQTPAPFGSPESLALMWSDDIDAVALATQSQGPAGQQFWYLNANSQVAGYALNNALKQAGETGYIDYFERKIWCPVGNGPAKMWLDREGGSPHYFSGMFATGRAWARIGELLRNKGNVGDAQVVSTDSLEAILAPSDVNPNYAAHIWLGKEWQARRQYNPTPAAAVIQSEPYLADDVIFFDGFGGQRVYVVPSARLTIVRTGKVSFAFDDAVIPNAVLAVLQDS